MPTPNKRRCLGPSKKEHTFTPTTAYPRICRKCRLRIDRIAPAAGMIEAVPVSTTKGKT